MNILLMIYSVDNNNSNIKITSLSILLKFHLILLLKDQNNPQNTKVNIKKTVNINFKAWKKFPLQNPSKSPKFI